MIRRIHIATTSTAGSPHFYFFRDAERLSELLRMAAEAPVEQVDQPGDADAIVFVGSTSTTLADISLSPVYRRYPERSFVLHGGDEPLPVLPGIYASIPRRWYQPAHHRGGFYLRVALDTSIPSMEGDTPTRLFSFVGSVANHRSREAVLEIHDPDALIVDSGAAPLPQEQARRRFLTSLRDSRFVLCPRGGGTSSFRIFETMKAARVPVVIADEWVPPTGPDWDAFSLRVPEAEIAGIPARLRACEHDAARMGAAARKAWERWFGPSTAGATIVGWLSDLAESRRAGGGLVMPMTMRIRRAAGLARHWLRHRNTAGSDRHVP